MTTVEVGSYRLDDETLLHLAGSDARKFLHGQTTADIENAASGSVIPGAFCDLKGRVLADFLAVVVAEDSIILRIKTSLQTLLLDHLKKYLAFARSDLTPLTGTVVGHIDSKADALDPVTATIDLERGEIVVPRWAGAAEQWFIEETQGALDASDDSSPWQRAAILEGEARVTADTWGAYLPQDLNYDLRHWVSFNKGCYTGQEVIARLHFRGKPKRRLTRASLELQDNTDSVPAIGSKLFTPERDQAVGSIVGAAPSPSGQAAWLLIECTDSGMESGLHLEGMQRHLSPLTA